MRERENEIKLDKETLAREIWLRQEEMSEKIRQQYYGKSLRKGTDLTGEPKDKIMEMLDFQNVSRFPQGKYGVDNKDKEMTIENQRGIISVRVKEPRKTVFTEYLDMTPGEEMVEVNITVGEDKETQGVMMLTFFFHHEGYDLYLWLLGKAIDEETPSSGRVALAAKFANNGRMIIPLL